MNRTFLPGKTSRLPDNLSRQMSPPAYTCPARRASASSSVAAMPSKCFIVGSGPGDPELVTVRLPVLSHYGCNMSLLASLNILSCLVLHKVGSVALANLYCR